MKVNWMNWMKWIEWIERGVENSGFWIGCCWKASWREGGGKPRFLNRILSPQCERGKICPFLFSKACGCVGVVLFFPLLGFSFSGCVEMESEKLQFSSQDEKYVGRICWSRGGANLIIPFLWGTSAGESNVGLQWEKRLQRAENWKRGPHLRSLMTMSEQWKEKGEIMIVMVKFGAVDGVLVAHICSILSNCFSRYESHPF